MKDAIKEVEKLVLEGKKEEAEKKLSLATKKIDKAAKANVIHKNTAARYKSRLAKKVNNTDTSKKASKTTKKKKTSSKKKKK